MQGPGNMTQSLRLIFLLLIFIFQFPYLALSANDRVAGGGAPVIVLGNITVIGGNGNNKIDPNECNQLTIELGNTGTGTATAVSAVLSSTTPEIIITQQNSNYPDIPPGVFVTNTTPFVVSSTPAFVCGRNVFLTLTVTSSDGTDVLNFILATGDTYTFSQSSGTITPGTTDIGLHCDDCSAVVSLPFPYFFYGQKMSSAAVSSNGNLQFNSNDTDFNNQCFPVSIFTDAILPHWDDLITDSSGDGVFTSVSGNAPNRIFNIEWRTEVITGGAVDFEAQLYEDRQRVDLIYGTVSFSGLGATVGIQKDTGSAFIQYSCNSPTLFNTLQINFENNICTPGNGSCGSCPAISLSPPVLPDGFKGVPYNESVVASGGAAPYSYAVTSGTLPAGLNLDSATGVISGTPTTNGDFPFTITATDNNGCQGSQNYTINIVDCAITIDPPLLPNGTVGVAYSQAISANGGNPTYTFAVTTGALPDGLTLDNSTGVISGTPTLQGSFNFTITAVDSVGCSGSRNYTLNITCPAIVLSPVTLPDGQPAIPYNQTISASGGTSPYTFTLVSGSLPSGLTLNAASGVISGSPSNIETASFTIRATDLNGCFGEQSYTLNISLNILFFDNFEDGILAKDWTYVSSIAFWSELGGNLIGTNVKKTSAVASPAFAGCVTCYVEASIQTAGGFGNRIWLLHNYIDKANTIELLVKEESDRLILKQRVGKAVVAKAKAEVAINPNQAYIVRITFDGAIYTVTIDGTPVITLVPVVAVPSGTVGFKVKGTTGTFGYIVVN
jgi:hypothetical protein